MKTINNIICIALISLIGINNALADDFDSWLTLFRDYAIKNGISKKTLDDTLSKVKFLPKVIQYDRYQPEFYEDTKTYISKRTSNEKVKKGKNLFIKNSSLIKVKNFKSISAYLKSINSKAILVRPDRFILGSANSNKEFNSIIKKYANILG